MLISAIHLVMSIEDDFWKRVEHQLSVLSLKYLDLWKAIKVSRNTGAGWIAKKRIPPAQSCLLICHTLGVSIEYLLTGVETALPDDSYTLEKPVEEYKKTIDRSKCHPRSLPDDLLGALVYCTDNQMRSIRQILNIPPIE
ncbi:MAG: hypothetical protein WCS18_03750 [Sphaerochaetaceae bacterium]|jgi:transcriptional regulator with XRE-family HTH domain